MIPLAATKAQGKRESGGWGFARSQRGGWGENDEEKEHDGSFAGNSWLVTKRSHFYYHTSYRSCLQPGSALYEVVRPLRQGSCQ